MHAVWEHAGSGNADELHEAGLAGVLTDAEVVSAEMAASSRAARDAVQHRVRLLGCGRAAPHVQALAELGPDPAITAAARAL